MWGPIGLSLMIAIGPGAFDAFLRGGQAMDRHFRAADPQENMPMLLALVGIWHNQVLGHATRAVLPYDQRLRMLPDYLQQLEMESNGKSVRMDGTDAAHHTGPVVWGRQAPTASTPSTSSFIRAPGSCPANSWSQPTVTSRTWPIITSYCCPIALHSPRR